MKEDDSAARRGLQRFSLLAAAFFLAFPALLIGSAAEEEARHLAFDRATPSRDLHLRALQLVAFSARIENNEIELRIGFVNTGTSTLTDQIALEAGDFNLVGTDYITRNPARSIDQALELPLPENTGLPPQRATTGSLHFSLPAHQDKLLLQVTGFPDLPLELDALTFQPPELSGLGLSAPLDLEVVGQKGAFSIIPWKIHSINLNEGSLSIRTSFTNKARAAITWASPLTGQHFRILDCEANLHEPVSLSDNLAAQIGPMQESWPTGHENLGTITFTTPHPHALRKLLLSFPGYPAVQLQLSPDGRTYLASVSGAAPDNDTEEGISPVLASELAYRQIVQLVAEMNKAFEERNPDAYLAAFRTDGTLRQRQNRFFTDTLKAPVKNIAYLLPPNQPFAIGPDGTIEDVYLRFHYNIRGIADDNYFVTVIKASFARGPTPSGWFVTHLATISRPPFWELGYTGICETDHFLIFYPSATESAKNVRKATQQVERAYEDLAFQGFELEERYAAFFVPSSDDFQALTMRDPERFSGVASSACEIVENEITTTNRAIYINDYRYLVQQRVWGVQDRQKTITHELVHLALSHHTRPFTPAWLVEGAAVHHAGQINSVTRDLLRRSSISQQLSHDEMSNSYLLGGSIKDSRTLALMYSFAGETFAFLRNKFGSRRVLDFYQAFGHPSSEDLDCILPARKTYTTHPSDAQMAEITQRMTRRLLRQHFGMSLRELTKAIKSSLRIR